jgi:predicted MPP superfamily phosphohydrolase
VAQLSVIQEKDMLNPFRRLGPTVTVLAVVFGLHSAASEEEDANAEKSFTVVLLPDTQNYSEKYPDTYVAQTLWIRERRKADNIKFVIHLGDIVQTSTKKPEWENADRAMRLLDGVVPYSIAPGNHDMVVKSRDSKLYNDTSRPRDLRTDHGTVDTWAKPTTTTSASLTRVG